MIKNIDTSVIADFYADDLAEINAEIEETESLYDELKTHFDQIKRSSAQGALNFISKQTPNLIALRKNKIDLIKERNTVRKTIMDTSVRLTVEESNDSKDDALLKELHKMLLSNKPEYYTNALEEADNELPENERLIQTEDDMEAKLAERMQSINEKKEQNKEKKSVKEQRAKKSRKKYRFVVDMEANIYAVDEDYNILDDDDIEYPDWEIEFYEDENGEIYAENQDEEIIEVISFDDEDYD